MHFHSIIAAAALFASLVNGHGMVMAVNGANGVTTGAPGREILPSQVLTE